MKCRCKESFIYKGSSKYLSVSSFLQILHNVLCQIVFFQHECVIGFSEAHFYFIRIIDIVNFFPIQSDYIIQFFGNKVHFIKVNLCGSLINKLQAFQLFRFLALRRSQSAYIDIQNRILKALRQKVCGKNRVFQNFSHFREQSFRILILFLLSHSYKRFQICKYRVFADGYDILPMNIRSIKKVKYRHCLSNASVIIPHFFLRGTFAVRHKFLKSEILTVYNIGIHQLTVLQLVIYPVTYMGKCNLRLHISRLIYQLLSVFESQD